MGWIQRLRNLSRRDRLDRDLDRELSFHIAEKMDELIESGMNEAEARLEARRIFGNATLQKERTRDVDIFRWIESVAQDFRYGLRMIRKTPLFTLVVVLSLAIGIGANATLFSLVDAMLLRKLPLERPNELVYFKWASRANWMALSSSGTTNRDPRTHEDTGTSFSYETFQRFRAQTKTLAGVISFAPIYGVTLSIDGKPGLSDIKGQLASGNYFSALGAEAAIGRVLTDDDDRLARPVAVISDRYWERQFDRAPDVLGKPIVVNGIPAAIVGVTRQGFVGTEGFAEPTDISLPIGLEPQLPIFGESRIKSPWSWWVRIMGRMNPGVTAAQVQAELNGVFLSSARDGWEMGPPKSRENSPPKAEVPRLVVLSGSRGLEDNVSQPSLILIPLVSVAAILLLIVSVNIANLLLARVAGRRTELSVRLAVGGSRGRVVRQLLTEIVLMSLIAGALSIVFTYWARGLIVSVLPAIDYDLRIDVPVLAFTVVFAVVVALLMGLAPALRATREQINPALKEGSRTLMGPQTRLSKTLLIGQVALSMVLLMAAGLFVRTVHNLRNVDVGFETKNILLFRVSPGTLKYDKMRTAQLYDQIMGHVAALPGVKAVTLSNSLLVSNSGDSSRIYFAGPELANQRGSVRLLRVHSNFFKVLGVPILGGRDLGSADTANSPQVAIINESMAHRMFGNSSPLGARLGFDEEHRRDIEIVGIAKDISVRASREPVTPTMFLLDTQDIPGAVAFLVRTAGDPHLLSNPIREAVRQIDSNIPVLGINTQDEQIEMGFIIERVFANSTAFFAVIALLLACIGLFGLMSYSVERRTNEIGVRMALGASRMDVVRLVMRQTFMLVFTGIIVGFALALGAGKIIATLPFLFKVAPNDPLALGVSIVTMITTAAIAAYLPTRRAARVDPSIALRSD